MQYHGRITDEFHYNDGTKSVYSLMYKFAVPEYVTTYEEYLIYDVIGMIGSVGGTLGMFIGFSFENLFSSCIQYVRNFSMK